MNPRPLLISLHLPKTAGSSFRIALQTHYGARFCGDYKDFPLNQPPLHRNLTALAGVARSALTVAGLRSHHSAACVHGHFLPLKYLPLAARSGRVRFVTWLRDPVERLVSHYYYWIRSYDPQTALPLHRRVIEQNWTLERFCLSPDLQNLYSQFLWGFRLERFDFIGLTEHFEDDFAIFTRHFLGAAMPVPQINTNKDRTTPLTCSDTTGNAPLYDLNPDLRHRINAFHARDAALYQHALTLRSAILLRLRNHEATPELENNRSR